MRNTYGVLNSKWIFFLFCKRLFPEFVIPIGGPLEFYSDCFLSPLPVLPEFQYPIVFFKSLLRRPVPSMILRMENHSSRTNSNPTGQNYSPRFLFTGPADNLHSGRERNPSPEPQVLHRASHPPRLKLLTLSNARHAASRFELLGSAPHARAGPLVQRIPSRGTRVLAEYLRSESGQLGTLEVVEILVAALRRRHLH